MQKTRDDFSIKPRYYETHKEQAKKYYQDNREQRKGYGRKYYQEHKEQKRKYRQEHKEHIKEQSAKWYQEHKEQKRKYQQKHQQEHKEQKRKYRQEHKEHIKEQSAKWYHEHKEQQHKHAVKYYQEHKEQKRKYRQEHKEYLAEWHRNWEKTENGKLSRKRKRAKRRNKKWIQILPNIFPKNIPVDYHHADGKWLVVPIPKRLHLKTYSRDITYHLEQANGWVEFYYDLNIDDFLHDGLTIPVGEKSK